MLVTWSLTISPFDLLNSEGENVQEKAMSTREMFPAFNMNLLAEFPTAYGLGIHISKSIPETFESTSLVMILCKLNFQFTNILSILALYK